MKLFDNYSGNIKNLLSLKYEIESEISKKEILKNLVDDEIVRCVRSIITPLSEQMLKTAANQQNNKKKSERPMYEFVKNEMVDRFFKGNKDAKLTKIISYGYDTRAFTFYFKFKGITFDIRYPVTKNASKDNIDSIRYGQYMLSYEESHSCYRIITSSYEEEEIANAIEEFVNKKEE